MFVDLFLQVRASLFAASCFCELAADFASVMLEMLLNIIRSPDSSLTIKLAGVRVFAKMGSSYSVANKAYKVLHPSYRISIYRSNNMRELRFKVF